MIGYPSGQDGALRTTRYIPQAKLCRKPYNESFIDRVCSVKIAGVGLIPFLLVYGPQLHLVHKHAKKELGQYPTILISHLDNPYIKEQVWLRMENINTDYKQRT